MNSSDPLSVSFSGSVPPGVITVASLPLYNAVVAGLLVVLWVFDAPRING